MIRAALHNLLLFSLMFWPLPAPAQGLHPVSGRKIAPVMGAAGANWLVRPEREREESPSLAVSLLGLKPGMAVADIGAGVGYYSFLIAQIVGPAGKVYATDLQPEMLRLMRQRMEKEKIANVEPVLGNETGTGLPDGRIDAALLVDVYHEFSEPQKMLAAIARALKPDGRLILLEFRQEDPTVPIREEHKMSVATVKQEFEAENYRMIKLIDRLPWQHILIFEKAKIQ